MGAPLCFSVIFTKGNNSYDFLFASLHGTLLKKKKKGQFFFKSTLKGKNLLLESKFFPLKVDFHQKKIGKQT